jgi:hypothetical protein
LLPFPGRCAGKAEKIDRGYLGRILQVTLLAPDTVEIILNGRQRTQLGLPRLMKPFPVDWAEQRACLMNPEPSDCYGSILNKHKRMAADRGSEVPQHDPGIATSSSAAAQLVRQIVAA